ncbi:MAG: DUF6056 family protein [Treponema sp.]|jgi:hypothetical protein|nr:DUF6056 family protein [Treponema sp.]
METQNRFNFFESIPWILSVGVILLFFVLNFFTPLIADDYNVPIGINSVADIVKYQYNQWLTWGGRCVAQFFAQFWLLAGKPVFNIANTIVYTLFVLLTCFHITGNWRKINPWIFLAINTFYWFLVPAWGQNFLWLGGSCVYLWTTTIVLFFLAPFKKRHDEKNYKLNMPLSLLFFFIGVLAGWSQENTGAAVLFLLAAYFVMKIIHKERITLFEITGAAGFLIGFALLIAAPGNYVRADVIKEMGGGHSGDALLIMLLKRFVDVTLIFFRTHGLTIIVAAAFFGFDLRYHQKHRINLFSYFYALAALASVYSMVLSPTLPDRAFLILFVFSVITLGNILGQYDIPLPAIVVRNKYIIVSLLLLSLFFSVISAGKNIVGIYLKWQNRIEYILSEKEKGNLDVEVKAPIPAIDRHAALYGLGDVLDDKDDWHNTSIAEYFGLRSIKRLDSNEPWESLW